MKSEYIQKLNTGLRKGVTSCSHRKTGTFSDLLRQIDTKADEYLHGVKGMVPEKRNERLNHIKKLFSKSREYGDDKVQLAMQTYEMVSAW